MMSTPDEARSAAERFVMRVGRASFLAWLLGAAALWIAANAALERPFDPFPYWWLQRAEVGVSGTLLLVALAARRHRIARERRRLRARHEHLH